MRSRRLGLTGAAVVLIILTTAVAIRTGTPPSLGATLGSPVAGAATPPPPGIPAVRVAIAGDPGTADAAARRTAAAIDEQETAREFDALLLLGDLIYETGDPGLVGPAVTEPFAGVLDTGTQLVPLLGNHDVKQGAQQEILAALGRSRSWYEQRIGPLRLVVLDSTRADDPAQTAWLEAVLAAPSASAEWTVVAMHHPAFSAGYHGADADVLDLRSRWAPLFAHYRVPLVLAGHDHDYQRSLPQDGVTYVVSGAAAKLRPTGSQPFTAVSASTRHFVDLLVYPDRLELRAVNQDGRLVDTATINRPPGVRPAGPEQPLRAR